MNEDDIELIKYFIKSKRVSISYITNKTGIPYGTIGYYMQNVDRLDSAREATLQTLYSFIKELGIEKKEDVDKIVKKVEYIVNN